MCRRLEKPDPFIIDQADVLHELESGAVIAVRCYEKEGPAPGSMGAQIWLGIL